MDAWGLKLGSRAYSAAILPTEQPLLPQGTSFSNCSALCDQMPDAAQPLWSGSSPGRCRCPNSPLCLDLQ